MPRTPRVVAQRPTNIKPKPRLFLVGLCNDVVAPATLQVGGDSFDMVLLMLEHVLPQAVSSNLDQHGSMWMHPVDASWRITSHYPPIPPNPPKPCPSRCLAQPRSWGSKITESPFLMSFRCRVTSTPPTREVSTSSILATSLMYRRQTSEDTAKQVAGTYGVDGEWKVRWLFAPKTGKGGWEVCQMGGLQMMRQPAIRKQVGCSAHRTWLVMAKMLEPRSGICNISLRSSLTPIWRPKVGRILFPMVDTDGQLQIDIGR